MSSAFTGHGSEPAFEDGPEGVAGNPDGSICRVEAVDPSKGVPDKDLDREYPLVPPYSRYADLYDHLDQTAFGLAVVSLIERLARARRPPVRRVLDLACGTGTVALWFAARGYNVTGVDRSPEMLSMATAKARRARARVHFIRQEMELLTLHEAFDLALCLYDSLNYILAISEIESVFSRVARALAPGGLFVFDVNTAHCLAADWGNRVLEERCPGTAITHLYSYDPSTGIGTLELFCLRSRGKQVEKFREIHQERGYTWQEIDGAIQRSGLTILESFSFPDMAPPAETSSRLVYITAKPDAGPESRGRK